MCLAVPGRILEVVDVTHRLAEVDITGVLRNVDIGLLDGQGAGARPGEWVLVHAGCAMARIDEAEATATLRSLQGMSADYEAELDALASVTG